MPYSFSACKLMSSSRKLNIYVNTYHIIFPHMPPIVGLILSFFHTPESEPGKIAECLSIIVLQPGIVPKFLIFNTIRYLRKNSFNWDAKFSTDGADVSLLYTYTTVQKSGNACSTEQLLTLVRLSDHKGYCSFIQVD